MAIDFIGHDASGGAVFAARFHPGCLDVLPWSSGEFECIVLQLEPQLRQESVLAVAREVALANTEWVHTTGSVAEVLHDAIDEISVSIGGQAAVGDGVPMTAWHDDVITVEQMICFATSVRFGGAENVLVLLVGDPAAYCQVMLALRKQVATDSREE
jgi:hypothetical protein